MPRPDARYLSPQTAGTARGCRGSCGWYGGSCPGAMEDTPERSVRGTGRARWVDRVSYRRLLDKVAEALLEAVAGKGCKSRHEVQVVRRGHDRHMAHVHSQLGKVRLHIGTFPIPAHERLDREAVAEIMNARPPAF